MNRLLFLLCCVEILGIGSAELSSGFTDVGDEEDEHMPSVKQDSTDFTSATGGTFETSTVMITETAFPFSTSRSASPSPGLEPTKVTTTTTPTTTTPTTTPAPTSTPNGQFFKKECVTLYMVAGGLIIACTILLISTFMLSWKVCQLKRHIKMLSSNSDLISTSEYWLGTAKKSKSNSGTQARETTVLMSEIGQTQDDAAEGATKEEGEKVNEEGQKGEENKKEAGDTASGEKASAGEDKKETPAAVAENSSSSKPQEKPSDTESTVAGAGSSSEGTEEPKDAQKS